MIIDRNPFKIHLVTVVAGLKIHVKNYSTYLAGISGREYPAGRRAWRE
jgi:hypothetical protein